MTPEQIETSTAAIVDRLTPGELNDLLDSSIEIDGEHHILTLREVIAKALVSISRNPGATKDCRKRALQVAKLYLKDFEKETE